MKIIFMGTPEFAIPTLKQLIASDHEIVAVYTQRPKLAGRGQKETLTPIHQLALENQLEVCTPKSLRGDEAAEIFKSHGADVAVIVAYGLILPNSILSIPKYGCINLHPSDLPRWRGAAPIQRTIIAGDTTSAICIMQMDEGVDTGDVLLKKKIDLDSKYTAGSWGASAAEIGSKMMLEVLANYGNINPIKQTEDGLTYANKLLKEEALIDWNRSATQIESLIRGLNPWPVAYFKYQDENIKIYEAEIIEQTGVPGTILDDKLTIACGDKAIRPILLQRPSKKIMSAKDLLLGYKIPVGTIISA